MKISNIQSFSGIDKKEKIDPNKIVITNLSDVWDGPLRGTCLYDSEEFYFFTFDRFSDDEDVWPRKYVLIKLNETQDDGNKKINEYFSRLKLGEITHEEYSSFYNSIAETQIDEDQIKGWFDSGNGKNNFMDSYFNLAKLV